MLLKVDNVGAERMSSGRLFQATGPATQNIAYSKIIIVFYILSSMTLLNQNITLDNALTRKKWLLNLLTWTIGTFCSNAI